MKDVKFYIPIKVKNKTILLSVDKIKIIKDCLPENEDIFEHLMVVQQLLKKDIPYRTIKVCVSDKDYFAMVKEINRKTSGEFKDNCINLVTDINNIAIIQIIKNS